MADQSRYWWIQDDHPVHIWRYRFESKFVPVQKIY